MDANFHPIANVPVENKLSVQPFGYLMILFPFQCRDSTLELLPVISDTATWSWRM